MSAYKAPLRDIDFVLHEVLGYQAHCESLRGDRELDRATVNALLDEYSKLCEAVIEPLNRSGDEEGCHLRDGRVHTPAGFREAYAQYAGAGWFSLSNATEYGGQGLPSSLSKISSEILSSANMGFALYASAIPGAITTLGKFATPQQRSLYESRLNSGEWNATMCLTEPHCGTDLGLLRTRAESKGDGSYAITGTKIFITGGDHDLTENIVHLVLARVRGAPDGTAGISLFIVPKINTTPDGSVISPNAVSCGALEKKMGVKASATCVMNFDGATGYLLGEENRGLAAMFTFINASRISAASQGVAHAELGFQKSLAYARERLQMRSLSGAKNPDGAADPIIVHPDVRRMLLTQKAFAEGNRLLTSYLAMELDLSRAAGGERTDASRRLDLLTPIAKAFATECGVEAAGLALQCFGGHGYIREWGVEQNLRDARIATLYEGTTGVQAMDLLGRKVLAGQQGKLEAFISEIEAFCTAATREGGETGRLIKVLEPHLQGWRETTHAIALRAAEDPEEIGAASVAYLMVCGYVLVAYLWLRAAAVAEARLSAGDDGDFYQSKLLTARFYFDHILPRTLSLRASIDNGAQSMMSLDAAHFQF